MTPKQQDAAPGLRCLKIAYLLPQFPVPTQTFAASDIAALQADGHGVLVYTMKPRGAAKPVPGIPVLRATIGGVLRWPRVLWRRRGPVLGLAAHLARHFGGSPRVAASALLCLPRAAEIAADIERQQPDVVHLFWARHAGLVLALLKARGFAGVRSAFVGAYDLVADDFLVELALRSADIAFSHAEANRDFVASRVAPGTRVKIVHRGIPLPELASHKARDPHRWVTASALVPEKNVEAVLQAFVHARAGTPQLTLSVFGEGPDRVRLEQWVRTHGCDDAVSFEGHVAREELVERMARADTFLLLSTKPSERLPNVVKEALWAGCRVISSDTVGIRELLPDDSYGHVVDPAEEAAVRSAVRAVLQRERSEDHAWQARVRALIAGKFSAATNMRQYVQAWTEGIAR